MLLPPSDHFPFHPSTESSDTGTRKERVDTGLLRERNLPPFFTSRQEPRGWQENEIGSVFQSRSLLCCREEAICLDRSCWSLQEGRKERQDRDTKEERKREREDLIFPSQVHTKERLKDEQFPCSLPVSCCSCCSSSSLSHSLQDVIYDTWDLMHETLLDFHGNRTNCFCCCLEWKVWNILRVLIFSVSCQIQEMNLRKLDQTIKERERNDSLSILIHVSCGCGYDLQSLIHGSPASLISPSSGRVGVRSEGEV